MVALVSAGEISGCAPLSPIESASKKAFAPLLGRLQSSARAPASSVSVGQESPRIVIDASQRLHSISPLIYGLAGGSETLSRQIRPALQRSGGNPASRYNWRIGNGWNAARDWEFRNVNYGNTSEEARWPSGVADAFFLTNRVAGVTSLLTLPALGWVAKDDRNGSASLDVPADGRPPLAGHTNGAIAGYDPALNRLRTSVPSFARSGGSFSPTNAVYQDEWIRHLIGRFGQAAHGGVQFYAIDNEPDLWSFTHTDVHPARMGYDAMLSTFLEYAGTVKDVDATAQVTGPVLSGWTAFFDSSLDKRDTKIDFLLASRDREAHGNVAFLPWWLAQVQAHDDRTGRRSLDVLDVHWYGTGYGSGGDDPEVNRRRLRSTRSLWDSSYVDESWIARTYDDEGVRGVVKLIPRLRGWIAKHYPGTKVGITEWNWGADDTPNGALTIADVLGIFGREGVDLAAYWQAPKVGSPGALAFQAYRNYDGHNGQFGEVAIAAAVTHPDRLSCYASLDENRSEIISVVLNKDDSEPLKVVLNLKHGASNAVMEGFQYAAAQGTVLRPLPSTRLRDGGTILTLPSTSITVLRLFSNT